MTQQSLPCALSSFYLALSSLSLSLSFSLFSLSFSLSLSLSAIALQADNLEFWWLAFVSSGFQRSEVTLFWCMLQQWGLELMI